MRTTTTAALILAVLAETWAAPLFAQPAAVALYAGPGADPAYVAALETSMAGRTDLVVRRVLPADILAGALGAFDVLAMPGGGSGGQSAALGPAGRDIVRAFIRDGGGYMGFCAGTYLATLDSPDNLRIANVRLVDADHWWRGAGTAGIRLTSDGQKILGVTGTDYAYRYVNGPLLAPAGDANLPACTTLATFTTELAQNGAPTGVMIGTTAIASAAYGAGRVFLTSGHPEFTPGLEGWVPRAARWAGRRVLRGRPIALRASADVNVRTGPGTAYPVVGRVPAANIYAGAFRAGGWWRIDFDGKTGWTNGAYYTAAPGIVAVKVNTEILNVRGGPGAVYTILGTVAYGQYYVVMSATPLNGGSTGLTSGGSTELTAGWYQILWAGRTGWVYAGYAVKVLL